LHFVIQKHDASRLHYDFRLENKNGLLKSWAVPRGVSTDPAVKRLAIMTEDHPGDYIDFEGEMPKGSYGAGSVIVWDTGTYQTESDIDGQIENGKIKFTLFGRKLRGSYTLVRTNKGHDQWLLIKGNDEYASSNEDLLATRPESVLTGKTIEPRKAPRDANHDNIPSLAKGFPTSVKPMLAIPIDRPFDNPDWVFEIKWDGIRAILFRNKSQGILQIRSRKGNEISYRYPELTSAVDSFVRCNNSVVLDGEIVVLDKDGKPDFQRHQSRMNVDDKREIMRLSREMPATYYVFDILYLDGMSVEHLPFVKRREILQQVITDSGVVRISDYIERLGKDTFQNAITMNLEGIVAKQKNSKYQQGTRSSAWLKVKGISTQDCVVIGYTRGEGNREALFGSLILAANDGGKLRFVGHSGSGFGFEQLEETLREMNELAIDHCPLDSIPYVNRQPVWLEPKLVVEVKFSGWTLQGIMRAPIFVRFREDKRPEECVIETPKKTDVVLSQRAPEEPSIHQMSINAPSRQSFTNMDKVFWPQSSSLPRPLTKGDLLDYYDSVSAYLLPHLRDRPLSLSRYPDGIQGKSFYHKNWDKAKPEYVKSIQVFSESSQRIINYLICNNKESLLWLANLGCVEMHPWYSRVHDFSACKKVAENSKEQAESAVLEEAKCGLAIPDFVVFDLDPYIYSGEEKKGQEPQFNLKGFKATVEVALMLKDLLKSLKIKSYVKTSGKTGLHIFVPVAPHLAYDQTRQFAQLIGRMLIQKASDKITMEWSTERRKGTVFFDYNQNAMGKTIASILSARPTTSATVSMPLDWKAIDKVLPTDFTLMNVPEILKQWGDPWKDILNAPQDLAKLLDTVSEVA
jgi:bifunctional non-homologous end joining protein LigD